MPRASGILGICLGYSKPRASSTLILVLSLGLVVFLG